MNTSTRPARPESDQKLDIREVGAEKDGVRQYSEKRLFLQLQVFGGCKDPQSLVKPLQDGGAEAVIYLDVNDPQSIGLLTLTENPDQFVGDYRAILQTKPFEALVQKPEYTMFGRTYSSGREENLEDWLLHKPRRTVANKDWSWAVWYPLRRKSDFALLSREEQGKILYQHAMLGRTYGQAGFATDVRLACYGIDKNDNEFVIGLIGSELYPLSRIVQDMRKTQQTAKYIESMGPFFAGKVFWQSEPKL